jgi:hypothetical protein
MDIKTAYQTLIENGMSPEEAIQQLKTEFDKLLSEGKIDDAAHAEAIKLIDGMNGQAEQVAPTDGEDVEATEEPVSGEPAMEQPAPTEPVEEEMVEEKPMAEAQETVAEPMDETEDKFALRAEELMESGEFEDFDEAYEFAMDEQSNGGDKSEMVQQIVVQFMNNEMDENQLLEMLKKMKAEQGGTAQQMPPQKGV